jgi:hypothetical protein
LDEEEEGGTVMQQQEITFNGMAMPLAEFAEEEPRETGKKQTKKSRIIELFTAGLTDIGEIAQRVGSWPSYVASVLQSSGLIRGYFDLYTTTAMDQNLYSRYFRNVLSFKNVEAAKESVEKIDKLYEHFERIGDRAGQHHAEVLALTGRNRARWSGKLEEARVFEEWLFNH